MTGDRDSKISDLYRLSSQETPAAHVDRAVLDRARRSVRRGAFSPFGNHWFAGAALVSGVVLSVLLILLVPQHHDGYAPERGVMVPSGDAPPEIQREAAPWQADSRASVPSSDARSGMQQEAAPRQADSTAPVRDALDPLRGALSKMKKETAPQQPGSTAPDRDTLTPSSHAAAGEESASPEATALPVTSYLQVGAFREQQRAIVLKKRLSRMGFKSEIQEANIDNTGVYHRVCIGPFTDPEAFARTKTELYALGFESRTLNAQGGR